MANSKPPPKHRPLIAATKTRGLASMRSSRAWKRREKARPPARSNFIISIPSAPPMKWLEPAPVNTNTWAGDASTSSSRASNWAMSGEFMELRSTWRSMTTQEIWGPGRRDK